MAKKTNFGPNFGPFGPNLTAHPQLQKKKKKKKNCGFYLF